MSAFEFAVVEGGAIVAMAVMGGVVGMIVSPTSIPAPLRGAIGALLAPVVVGGAIAAAVALPAAILLGMV